MKFSKYFCRLMALMFLFVLHAPALVQERYALSSGTEDVAASKWERSAAFAGVTVLGLTSWDHVYPVHTPPTLLVAYSARSGTLQVES